MAMRNVLRPVPSVEEAFSRPLKIVHVADFFFSLKIRAPGQCSVGGKLSQGLVRNGHHVIDFSYRDVARARSWMNSRSLGKAALVRALRDFVASSCPDVLLLGHGYMIAPEVIADIRRSQPGMTVIQWNIDALFVPENARNFAARHQVVDASFISTAGPRLRALVGKTGLTGFLPNPVDHSVERGRAFSRTEGLADLFYACGNPARERIIAGKAWHMEEFCQALEVALPKDFRFSWAGVRGQTYLGGAAYVQALENAAIGLNISRRADYYLYSSDRLAHMVGNGQLVFMERQTGYDYFFSDDEMVFFESFEELIEKLAWFYRNPGIRQKTAEAGWRRYHALFNERSVADYLLRHSLGVLREEDYPWRRDIFRG